MKEKKQQTHNKSIFQNSKTSYFKISNFIISNYQKLNIQNIRIQNSKIQKFKFSEIQHLNLQFVKFHGPASILKYQKNVKLRQKQFHMKDRGKSSSRKLRRAIYYILYRMDPKKTQYKNSCSAKMLNIENWEHFRIYFPPNSRSTAL